MICCMAIATSIVFGLAQLRHLGVKGLAVALAGVKEVEGLPSYSTDVRRLLDAGPVVAKKAQLDAGDIVESIRR